MNRSFVNNELSLFSYEILALVGSDGAGAHDLLRMARHGRLLDWAGESQYYAEPKRLAKLGYLDARKEPGRTRERTVYTLTDKGRQALADYANTPVTVTPLKSEPLLRLLICDLVGEEVTRESLATLRDDIADLRRRLDDSERNDRPRRARVRQTAENARPCEPQHPRDLNHGLAARLAVRRVERLGWSADCEQHPLRADGHRREAVGSSADDGHRSEGK